MKKNKFMTIYLREDEWNFIKRVMVKCEDECEKVLIRQQNLNIKPSETLLKQYNLVYHFNHIGVDNIEELARKEERRRKRDKSKQKKD